MKKIVAITTTPNERMKIEAAISAIRAVMQRFTAENVGLLQYVPRAVLTVGPTDHFWKVEFPDKLVPDTEGRTLDAIFEDLMNHTDAEFKRARAKIFRNAADELEREAAAEEAKGGEA